METANTKGQAMMTAKEYFQKMVEAGLSLDDMRHNVELAIKKSAQGTDQYSVVCELSEIVSAARERKERDDLEGLRNLVGKIRAER
jgi:hypothetical protein